MGYIQTFWGKKFRGLPNFKHFEEINFCEWKLFEILKKKNQEHDLCKREKASRFLFCFISFLFIHLNKIYKN